jgi:hypothetical protein
MITKRTPIDYGEALRVEWVTPTSDLHAQLDLRGNLDCVAY